VGTPSVTTQGMTEPQMAQIAQLIGRAVTSEDSGVHAEIRAEVSALVAAHPAYPQG
jgi:glycine hydroxymethyltransferase